jgi:hypothetical protein
MAKQPLTILDVEQRKVVANERIWRDFLKVVPPVAKWGALVIISGFIFLGVQGLAGKNTLVKMDLPSLVVDWFSYIAGVIGVGFGLFERNMRIKTERTQKGQIVSSYDITIGGKKND